MDDLDDTELDVGAYGELYPDAADRLRDILRSRDPKIRRRLAVYAEVQKLRRENRLQQLRRLYGLTSTEARVALHFVDGGDVASYAAAAGVARGTVRAQLKAIFAKTGVNRQAALTRLLG